ncbi:PH, RCC1 and FYVE domains-containing protein 1 [Pistacia vera]|uniref:PH, RCC1 and FYVE domains-containing protein 1 n=1 Tax=Pistacia vera TaxID=55513 RepID=UPI0012631DC2|nr:PH, RCC1 and FYVE domains-containing protein 1 [Pistacia vera]
MVEEELLTTLPFDRTVEQAILSIKKGAHLLKCGRRGKPKFCPFRLSLDEKFLIWYSGQREKQLRLSSVTKIVTGQKTINFQRQLQPDRELQSFSLIYANGERSLDLICKDKVQADSWFIGLRAVILRCHRSRPCASLRGRRGIQSCVSSPASYIRRKHNLGLVEDATELSQVRSLCGSPSLSLSERCFSDGLSYSSKSFYSSESSLLHVQNVVNISTPNSNFTETDNFEKWASNYTGKECLKNESQRFVAPTYGSPLIEKEDVLKDVMIWGEGVFGGIIGGASDCSASQNKMVVDALLPKLLESTKMLDVQSIALGGKHAALVTKQGEIFCWGEGKGGRLGHKVNVDVSYPKLVESLNGAVVQYVSCGEFQTCARTKSGELYIWGDNNHGADMVGEMGSRSHWLPRKLCGPLDCVTISKVACGEWHTAIVSTSGQLFTYGDGTFGVLGHGNLQNVFQPKEVESLRGLRVKSVACGPWHTAAIVEIMTDRYKSVAIGGKLFTWGDGDKGRLGHADGERKLLPTCVAQLVDFDFVQVSCGRMLTVGLTSSGKVYTMGSAVHGQLGNPQAKDKSITVVEEKLKEEFVKEISSGSYHIAVLTSGGNVYTWGKNANGQLGLGDIQDRNSPAFVEALRDRKVESIVCGSSLTAAICLHRSITVSDQSACSGCKMPFGFRRKKRNCYNCGLLFCSVCSGKKVTNASLTPNKDKPSRVCDTCFNHLQKVTHSGRLLKLENRSPRSLMNSQGVLSEEKDERGEVTPTRGQLYSSKQICDVECKPGEPRTLKTRGERQQHLELVSSLTSGLQRWGQVPCPIQFEMHRVDNSLALAPLSNNQLSSCSALSAGSNSSIPIAFKEDKVLSESNKTLTDEVQRLRAEARSLEMQCQIGEHKFQDCQRKIEEAWSLAREEAAKCKAAKEIIKALAVRLHTMSEKVAAGREAKDGVVADLPQVTTVQKNSTKLDASHPMFTATNVLPEVKLPKERKVDSLCNSPIVFSDTLKSVYGRDFHHDNSYRSVEDSHVAKTEPQQKGTKSSKPEWVEQCEPGIYITFTILQSGQKGLKRVRFSRKRFTEKEAERWWDENQVVVYQKYGIEEYTNSNQNQMKC